MKDALSEFQDLREGGRLEAKAAQGGLPRSLWETYSAFANTDGGTLLLGMREKPNGQLVPVGVEDPQGLLDVFWNTVNNRNKVSHQIVSESNVAVVPVDGRAVVAISVPRASRFVRPVYLDGNPFTGTFRRNGSGDYRCTEDEVRSLIRDASSENLDERVVAEGATLGDLNAETVEAYRQELRAHRPTHPWLRLAIPDFLVRIGAAAVVEGEQTPRPTEAGLLMFGEEYAIVREFPQYLLDYREVTARRRWDHRITSMDGTWSGNLFDFWYRVASRIAEDLPRPFALDDQLHRIDDTPLHKAVREALTNTLVHADYHGARHTVIVRRPDRIELSNPGGLRIPAEVALEGGLSDARNGMLARMFALVGMGERAGSGLESIRLAWHDAGLPAPELTEGFGPDRTSLVLHLRQNVNGQGDRDELTWQREPVVRMTTITSEGDAVMRLFATTWRLTRADVQKALGVNETKAKRLLTGLRDEGRLETHGAGRGVYYTQAGR